MAPPITVDIIAFLLRRSRCARNALAAGPIVLQKISLKTAPNKPTLHSRNGSKYVACRTTPARAVAPLLPAAKPMRRLHGRGADYDCMRQLRPHPRPPGR